MVELFISVGPDSLDATYYVPPFAPPDSNGYPGILFVHGFGGDKNWDTASAAIWATQGYVSLCYSVRAHGNSSGLSSIMGPSERGDLARVVEFLRNLPEVNADRIGIQGGSQGGLHCLWAVADSLPVRASAGDVITPRWASDMFANGAIRHTVTFLLQTPSVRYGPDRDSLWELVRADEYDLLRQRFTAGRDLDTARMHASRIPLVTFMKWQDHYFSAQDGIESYLRQHSPRKMYLGTGGHFSDVDYEELLYQWDIIDRWLDHFVLDDSNGILDEPPVTYAASSLPVDEDGYFNWSRRELPTWPPPDMKRARFYLHGDSLLLFNAPVTTGDSVTVRNDWDGVYSFDEGFIEGFRGARFESALPKQEVAFETPPLLSDMQWVGPPGVGLHLRSDFEKFPLHAQLFEVDTSGMKHLVNRVNFIGRDWTPGESMYVELEGIAHAHTFTRGNRIRLELTNLDDQDRVVWGKTPFVLPLFHRSGVTLYLDSARASFIEFPVVGQPPRVVPVASFDAQFDGESESVLVTWSTHREIDVAGYYVEWRADPGEKFEVLGFVPPAAGSTSHLPQEYLYRDSTYSGGPRWYRLRQISLSGETYRTDPVSLDVTVEVRGPEVPLLFSLEQNYPNPFNPVTRIRFTLPERSRVVLQVFDILGQEVDVLVDGNMEAGSHLLEWDAAAYAGGVYYCRLSAGGRTSLRKMILLK
jgi:predicted acyl esterase